MTGHFIVVGRLGGDESCGSAGEQENPDEGGKACHDFHGLHVEQKDDGTHDGKQAEQDDAAQHARNRHAAHEGIMVVPRSVDTAVSDEGNQHTQQGDKPHSDV